MGGQPETVYYVDCIVYTISMFVRLFLLKRLIGLNIIDYIKNVFARDILTIIPVVSIGILIVNSYESTINRLFFNIGILVFVSGLSSLFIGMTYAERAAIFNLITKKVKTCLK